MRIANDYQHARAMGIITRWQLRYGEDVRSRTAVRLVDAVVAYEKARWP